MATRTYARFLLLFSIAALAITPSSTARGSDRPARGYQSYSYFGRSSADLVVRPDVILVDFTLTKTTDDPVAGLGAIQTYVDELKKRYQSASSANAEIRVRNLSVRPATEKPDSPLQTIAVSGAIELPLAAEWDYWKRARLLVSIVQLAKAVAAEQKDARKAILATIGAPTALVKDPDAYRTELIVIWTYHVRTFSARAESGAAPLEVQQCDPPGKVNQQPVSLEEVALVLPINCRLDVAKGK
jgi:hypothetical protein